MAVTADVESSAGEGGRAENGLAEFNPTGDFSFLAAEIDDLANPSLAEKKEPISRARNGATAERALDPRSPEPGPRPAIDAGEHPGIIDEVDFLPSNGLTAMRVGASR